MTKTITPVNVQISEREARYLVDLIEWAKAKGYKVNDWDELGMQSLEFVAEAIIDETVRNYGRGTGGSWEEKNCVGDHMRGLHSNYFNCTIYSNGSTFNTECPFCE